MTNPSYVFAIFRYLDVPVWIHFLEVNPLLKWEHVCKLREAPAYLLISPRSLSPHAVKRRPFAAGVDDGHESSNACDGPCLPGARIGRWILDTGFGMVETKMIYPLKIGALEDDDSISSWVSAHLFGVSC